MTIFLENVSININILNWFLENYTCHVDDDTRENYLLLKNNIEGWKKGANLRSNIRSSTNDKLESEKIKENLSLYLNQLSATNYNTLERKIKNEIENSSDASNILLDLILNIGLQQENNLELLITLVSNLKMTKGIIQKLIIKLDEINIVKIDQSNYNQLCIDTRNNLIFKNGYICLALIFIRSNELSIDTIKKNMNRLEKELDNEDKEIVEKYMEVFIELMKRLSHKLKDIDNIFYKTIIDKLNIWKNDKNRFASRARFAILDFFDSIE